MRPSLRRSLRRSLLLAACGLALWGCAADDVLRYDGVTTSAGDSAAANTVMQMADPWPRGVEKTRLRVPAERPAAGEKK